MFLLRIFDSANISSRCFGTVRGVQTPGGRKRQRLKGFNGNFGDELEVLKTSKMKIENKDLKNKGDFKLK